MKSHRTATFLAAILGFGLLISGTSFARDSYGGDYDDHDYEFRDRNNRKRIVLDFYDEVFRGNSTLRLKREIRNQYPRLNLDRYELKRVRLVAKTRRGRGEARLHVGRSATRWQNVPGNRWEFQDDSSYTFSRTTFSNPSWHSEGRWVIELQGKFKVRRVVVILKRDYQDRRDRRRDRDDNGRRRRVYR